MYKKYLEFPTLFMLAKSTYSRCFMSNPIGCSIGPKENCSSTYLIIIQEGISHTEEDLCTIDCSNI